jgi:hypothetical protein
MNTTKFECEACGRTKDHDPARGHVPPGWRMRPIQGRVFQLCDSCSNEGHFIGGLSPHLKGMLRGRGFAIEDE